MIHIEDLSFHYRRKEPLFNSLNLNLPAGNIYGLLGRNGAGKSSLLKIIAGLLFPRHGSVDVDGFQSKDRFPHFLREVYLITEEFQLPSITMERFIKLYSPFYPRFNHNLFGKYMLEFQLPLWQKLSTFSYGQKKKFLLSFGLATDCKLLILDEPTNGLDIPSKSQFRKVVASAIHDERSFIISTHQVRDMENLIDPIIILEEGKIVFNRSYEEISGKLAFVKEADLPDTESTLYFEPALGGYTVVKENTDADETRMNLEMLFNAVISNTDKINEVFKS